MPVQKLLERLQRVSKHSNDRYRAVCPAHDSKHNTQSLAIREMSDGTVLLTCFAGCSAADVIAAVGLEFKDLFPDRGEQIDHRRKPGQPSHWQSMKQALETVREEVLIVTLTAYDVANCRKISKEDSDRVVQAAARIRAACDACL